jgi:hypothetical protein
LARLLLPFARDLATIGWIDGAVCSGVIGPCCHGTDESEVYRDLCQIVDEWIEIARRDGRPLPPPTAGRNVAKMLA